MKIASSAATHAHALPRACALLAVSFGATCIWLNSQPEGVPDSASAQGERPMINLPARSEPAQPARTSTRGRAQVTLVPTEPLPAHLLAALVEAGISADDSEQRSLAIQELSRASADQSLAGLERILLENRDTRSRRTALDALMQLPDSPQVRRQRKQLLDMLARDADAGIAEAARMASAATG